MKKHLKQTLARLNSEKIVAKCNFPERQWPVLRWLELLVWCDPQVASCGCGWQQVTSYLCQIIAYDSSVPLFALGQPQFNFNFHIFLSWQLCKNYFMNVATGCLSLLHLLRSTIALLEKSNLYF
jgi:hypothetical protein